VNDQTVHLAATLANCQAVHALAGWQAGQVVFRRIRPDLQVVQTKLYTRKRLPPVLLGACHLAPFRLTFGVGVIKLPTVSYRSPVRRVDMVLEVGVALRAPAAWRSAWQAAASSHLCKAYSQVITDIMWRIKA
jgi:hypothetical protein